MTHSSKAPAIRQVPAPAGSTAKAASAYARFIPREELTGFAAWCPAALGEPQAAAPATGMAAAAAAPEPEPVPEPAGPTAEDLQREVHAARQAGYQDGYRDGLVALESFKQSFAQQMAQQLGTLVGAFDAEFEALEHRIAEAVAATASALARQVVRSELATRPELVVQVAEDAMQALLLSARHVRVLVHPDDQPLVADGAGETLAARGARLVASNSVARGGCLIESDVGTIDARLEHRWAQAAASLGTEMGWTDPAPGEDDA